MQSATRLVSEEHEQFRTSLRDFVSREITPYVNDWDEAGTFPRELYRRAAQLGATGLGFPEEYGGSPGDVFFRLILAEEYACCGAGGLQASINSHTIALPPIVAAGSEQLKHLVLPSVIKGEKIAALAVTEPGGGSDVAAVRTRAVRDGDHYGAAAKYTLIPPASENV